MKTIEDKLHIAHELGRISGAAECIEDEGTRDTIYGAAESLFDGMLAEAGEEAKASREKTASLIKLAQNYPPDPFDFVETGEMVEKEPAPKKETNFDRLTQSPESLAVFLAQNAEACARGECTRPEDPTLRECVQCMIDWLREEHTDD